MKDDADGLDEEARSSRPSRLRRISSHPLTHLLAAVLILALIQGFIVKVYRVPSGSMEHTLEVGDLMLVNRLAYGPVSGDGPQRGDVVVFHVQPDLWPRGGVDGAELSEQGGPRDLFEWLKHAAKWTLGDLLGYGPGVNSMLVKRVLGTEGQTVECCDAGGSLLVDGESFDEPYVFEDLPFAAGVLDCGTLPRSARCFGPVTVPEGRLLMLGDHRSASGDSVSLCRGSEEQPQACVRWARVEDVIGEVWLVVWPPGDFGAPE